MDDCCYERPNMLSLPEAGADLLSFKRQASERRDAHDALMGGGPAAFPVGNTAILDDPQERLRELDDFEELHMSEHEEQHEQLAMRHVLEASASRSFLSKLQDDEADLAPYLAAVEGILNDPAFDCEQDKALPVTILPHLLLGDQFSAWDANTLKALGVTHVVNCANVANRGLLDHAELGIDYLELDAEDSIAYEIMQHHAQASERVRVCRDGGGVCLLHCQAGINRSGALVAAELIAGERFTLLDAVALLRKARGQVLINRSFQIALVRFAKAEGLLGGLPGASIS